MPSLSLLVISTCELREVVTGHFEKKAENKRMAERWMASAAAKSQTGQCKIPQR